MPIVDRCPTVDDVRTTDFTAVVRDSEIPEHGHYSRLLLAAAKKVRESGDVPHALVLDFLGHIMGIAIVVESPNQPFRPAIIMGHERSATAEDLSDEELDLLVAVWPTIELPEIRARACDLVWVRRRSHSAAEAAVEAYIGSAAALEAHRPQILAATRLTRALQLARLLQNHGLEGHVRAAVDATLARSADRLVLVRKLVELELDFGLADNWQTRHDLVKRSALAMEADGRFDGAHDWWLLAARCCVSGKDGKAAGAARVRAAEALLRCADSCGSALFEADYLSRVILELRKVPGQRDRVRAIQRRMDAVQQDAVYELKPMSVPMDVSNLAAQARASVRGKGVAEAVTSLAQLLQPPSVAAQRNAAASEIDEHPLVHGFQTTHLGSAGKTSAKTPGASAKDGREQRVFAVMAQHYSMSRHMSVVGGILPAVQQINLEHFVGSEDFLALAHASPFVPAGREGAFSRGLTAGMHLELDFAVHMLVPQLEQALRSALHLRGVVTARLNDAGIEEETELNAFLRDGRCRTVLEELFGEDTVMDLRLLLVERPGANFRNRLMHGLMSPPEFESVDALYLWWSVLRLCVLTAEARRTAQPKSRA